VFDFEKHSKNGRSQQEKNKAETIRVKIDNNYSEK